MAGLRFQFSLKWLVAVAFSVGMLLGLWGIYVESQRKVIIFTPEYEAELFTEWERRWYVDQPDHPSQQYAAEEEPGSASK